MLVVALSSSAEEKQMVVPHDRFAMWTWEEKLYIDAVDAEGTPSLLVLLALALAYICLSGIWKGVETAGGRPLSKDLCGAVTA